MTNARCLTNARVGWAGLELTGPITKSFASLVRHVVGLFLTLETPEAYKTNQLRDCCRKSHPIVRQTTFHPLLLMIQVIFFCPMYTGVKQT